MNKSEANGLAIFLAKKCRWTISQFEKWAEEYTERNPILTTSEAIVNTHKPQDGEILEIISHGGYVRRLIDGLYKLYDDGIGDELEYFLNRGDTAIKTVKRLSDGVVFTVGDHTRDGVIEKFYIGWAGMEVHYTNGSGSTLRSAVLEKVKQPIFPTSNGVDVYENDVYYKVLHDFRIAEYTPTASSTYEPDYIKTTFSKREMAEEYVIYNKPMFSVADVEKIRKYKGTFGLNLASELTKLAKEKINDVK